MEFSSFAVRDVRVSPALTFQEMSKNSKRYLEASGEWELVDILGETSILQFGIDEWDIITFWVRETRLLLISANTTAVKTLFGYQTTSAAKAHELAYHI